MAMRVGALNFSKGEIAEELIARVDVPSYNASLKQARNVVVLKYGGVQKRPGTRLVAPVLSAGPRLIPFQFSLTQAYALEFGQGYMRAAANGGVVLEQALTITAITKATQAQVSASFHGYSVGEQVYFNNVAGMTEINGRIAFVTEVVNDSNFKVSIDSTNFSTFTGDTGGITNLSPPPAPPAPVPPTPPPASTPPPATGGGGVLVTGPSGGLVNPGGHDSQPGEDPF